MLQRFKNTVVYRMEATNSKYLSVPAVMKQTPVWRSKQLLQPTHSSSHWSARLSPSPRSRFSVTVQLLCDCEHCVFLWGSFPCTHWWSFQYECNAEHIVLIMIPTTNQSIHPFIHLTSLFPNAPFPVHTPWRALCILGEFWHHHWFFCCCIFP